MTTTPDKLKRFLILPVLALAACGGAAEAVRNTEPADEPAEVSDDVEIAMLDALWEPDEVCPPLRDLEATGMDMDTVHNFALSSFEEGYEQELSADARIHLLYLMGTC